MNYIHLAEYGSFKKYADMYIFLILFNDHIFNTVFQKLKNILAYFLKDKIRKMTLIINFKKISLASCCFLEHQ